MIPFAEWTPDVADVGSGGTTIASGVQPASNGYLPWQQPVVYSNAAPRAPVWRRYGVSHRRIEADVRGRRDEALQAECHDVGLG